MFFKVVTVQRVIKAILAAGVISCLLYVALIDFSIRRSNNAAGVPLPIPAGRSSDAVFGGPFEQQQHPPYKQHMQVVQPFEAVIPERYDEAVVKTRLISEKIKRLTGKVIHSETIPVSNRTDSGVNYNVHIFYYCPVSWWSPSSTRVSRNEQLNIAFYPELGIYNCTEPVIDRHFHQINKTGIGVVLYSWTMDMARQSNDIMPVIFQQAKHHQLKVSFVLENFPGRSVKAIRDQIEFIVDEYSHLESFNRIYDQERKEYYPVFYLKDTHHAGIKESQWRELFNKKSPLSVRGTKYDGIFLNHITTKESLASSKRSGFNGLFTYSASNGQTYASTWKHWHDISQFAHQYKMLFIPTLGPGYAERVSKENPNHKEKHHVIRHRTNGNYYGVGWRTVIQLQNDAFVSISSFNQWAEGTQIEPAIPRPTYRDYSNKSGNYSSTKYLDLTHYWIGEFTDQKKTEEDSLHFCQAPKNATQKDEAKLQLTSAVKSVKQRSRL